MQIYITLLKIQILQNHVLLSFHLRIVIDLCYSTMLDLKKIE